MKNIFLAVALFGIGCGSTPIDPSAQETWSVTVGNWETPVCRGKMVTVGTEKLSGSWTCGTFGRAMSGSILPDGRVFLDMETSPGFFNHVRARTDSDVISGEILLNDVDTPFSAVRQ